MNLNSSRNHNSISQSSSSKVIHSSRGNNRSGNNEVQMSRKNYSSFTKNEESVQHDFNKSDNEDDSLDNWEGDEDE